MGKKLFLIVGIIILISLFFTLRQKETKTASPGQPEVSATVSENDPPQIVSTKPDPLENNVVSADQVIEITFNKPLQNSGEFKLRIEPKIEFSINLSGDRKTAKISFPKPLELSTTYTIFIGPDTKFDGAGAWGMEKIYHFKTITYRGV